LASTVLSGSLMSEQAEQLKRRTRRFALDIIHLLKLLPALEPGPTIRRQLAKSATSMDMNYRASCRARSHAEFTAKIGVVAEEADETAEWLDMIADARLVTFPGLLQLRKESRERLAIFSASVGTARRKERSR
jgi:four helix bundle protein